MFREGLLVVISGPSGSGKSTVRKSLKENDDDIKFSVSATTREPRSDEVEGQSYFFKTGDEFKRMIENDELIEWDEYCGNYYGTPKKFVEDTLKSGFDVILEITVKGAENIKKMYPDSILVFIIPPSIEELKKRIEGRGTERSEVVELRIEKAKKEMKSIDHYDYVVLNDNVENAVMNIRNIIVVEKLRYVRNRSGLAQFEL